MSIVYSRKQADFITAPFEHTLEVCEGSPRSGKTFAAIARFAIHLIQSRDRMHLVVGYSAEQAFRLVMDGDGFGLVHIFGETAEIKRDDTGDHLLVHMPDGTEKKVYWKGGGKADSKNSITGLSLGSVYFCEINLLHMGMIQECLRRTYAAHDRWHIADLNPPAPLHPVITDVFEVQDTKWTHWTCADNPILTRTRLKEIEEACSKNPYLYKRDWLGERAIPEGVIYWMFDPAKHVIPKIPDGETIKEIFISGDGGTTDATSVDAWSVCYKIEDGRKIHTLYHLATWYYDGGQMAMSDQARKIVGDFLPYVRQTYGRKETGVYIDPACKALRLELDKLGCFTSKADNNARDSINGRTGLMCGIEMLQTGIQDGHVYWIDDPKYGPLPTIKEAGLYCLDKHGAPVDAYNHNMDSLRYGYNHFAKNYGLWGAAIKVKSRPAGL